MKHLFSLMILLFAMSTYANEPQSTEFEKQLSAVEFKTAKFISGKEKMANGFANLAPNIRLIACGAYPVELDKETIGNLRMDIANLEQIKTIELLSTEQQTRLTIQKEIVETLTPGIDCSTLK